MISMRLLAVLISVRGFTVPSRAARATAAARAVLPAPGIAEQLELSARLLVAGAAGASLGLERQTRPGAPESPVSVRTMCLVSLGTALFACAGPRIAAAAGTGVGFLGAGAIRLEDGTRLRGASTATSVWVSAGLGAVAGRGLWRVAALGTGLAIAVSRRLRPVAAVRAGKELREAPDASPGARA